jgi:hypothetical protein
MPFTVCGATTGTTRSGLTVPGRKSLIPLEMKDLGRTRADQSSSLIFHGSPLARIHNH